MLLAGYQHVPLEGFWNLYLDISGKWPVQPMELVLMVIFIVSKTTKNAVVVWWQVRQTVFKTFVGFTNCS